nr:MAG TPA: hypothetical protein [Caudoviricetes sp.]
MQPFIKIFLILCGTLLVEYTHPVNNQGAM